MSSSWLAVVSSVRARLAVLVTLNLALWFALEEDFLVYSPLVIFIGMAAFFGRDGVFAFGVACSTGYGLYLLAWVLASVFDWVAAFAVSLSFALASASLETMSSLSAAWDWSEFWFFLSGFVVVLAVFMALLVVLSLWIEFQDRFTTVPSAPADDDDDDVPPPPPLLRRWFDQAIRVLPGAVFTCFGLIWYLGIFSAVLCVALCRKIWHLIPRPPPPRRRPILHPLPHHGRTGHMKPAPQIKTDSGKKEEAERYAQFDPWGRAPSSSYSASKPSVLGTGRPTFSPPGLYRPTSRYDTRPYHERLVLQGARPKFSPSLLVDPRPKLAVSHLSLELAPPRGLHELPGAGPHAASTSLPPATSSPLVLHDPSLGSLQLQFQQEQQLQLQLQFQQEQQLQFQQQQQQLYFQQQLQFQQQFQQKCQQQQQQQQLQEEIQEVTILMTKMTMDEDEADDDLMDDGDPMDDDDPMDVDDPVDIDELSLPLPQSTPLPSSPLPFSPLPSSPLPFSPLQSFPLPFSPLQSSPLPFSPLPSSPPMLLAVGLDSTAAPAMVETPAVVAAPIVPAVTAIPVTSPAPPAGLSSSSLVPLEPAASAPVPPPASLGPSAGPATHRKMKQPKGKGIMVKASTPTDWTKVAKDPPLYYESRLSGSARAAGANDKPQFHPGHLALPTSPVGPAAVSPVAGQSAEEAQTKRDDAEELERQKDEFEGFDEEAAAFLAEDDAVPSLPASGSGSAVAAPFSGFGASASAPVSSFGDLGAMFAAGPNSTLAGPASRLGPRPAVRAGVLGPRPAARTGILARGKKNPKPKSRDGPSNPLGMTAPFDPRVKNLANEQAHLKAETRRLRETMGESASAWSEPIDPADESPVSDEDDEDNLDNAAPILSRIPSHLITGKWKK
ncbi:hypothetical protein BJ170DRAFT_684078 [Xylariales sp. AK1849]|nr:hypothetical protein BJ170DRAFT_684078 [Xylariales sp. AK1849]